MAEGLDLATGRRPVLEALVGVPFTDGNRIDVLKDGEQTFGALLDAVSAARRTIDMLWFAWDRGAVAGQVADALAERAAAGVRVRILLDDFGGRHIQRQHLRRLRASGCTVVFYRPLPSWRPTVWNMRTHRRVVVCDETVAVTGEPGSTGCGPGAATGRGLAGHRLPGRGPAVAGLRSAFITSWMQAYIRLPGDLVSDRDEFPVLAAAGNAAVQVLRPPSQPGWNEAAVAIAALLHTTRHTVRMTTPYARLPRWLLDLVVATAGRGVRVQLLVSGPHVARPAVHLQGETQFQPLLDAGVEIWRFQPTLMHAKVITVDGVAALVGTANIDARSLALNEQVCLVIEDRAVVDVLDADFDEDLRASERVDPGSGVPAACGAGPWRRPPSWWAGRCAAGEHWGWPDAHPDRCCLRAVTPARSPGSRCQRAERRRGPSRTPGRSGAPDRSVTFTGRGVEAPGRGYRPLHPSPAGHGRPDQRRTMNRTSLPARRHRWRSAAAGVAIAAASFTMTACGEEEPVDDGGVVEEGVGDEEDMEEEEED
ncbi:phospholipase D-like domain-containing protein [Blastococcus brunescens]|uniref:Phospholipase D-like domain-containing protein n=1 Tax=Blastococcus brunescens TaxID=1564165 RepID=A0ABZ1B7K7_9ACTN|nr:phospholipase D-like domain-containing protein [Blastococcus sp. BMG 8361]WRL66362.1 phospholipase D-like domain-containing protein [Blastococcus sp. BMG 8361]